MAEEKDLQFAEDDDLARARRFWNTNGKSILAGVIVGLGGIVGFNFWDGYQQTQGENASVLYEQINSGDENINIDVVVDELKSNYKTTTYAALAAFEMAKIAVQENMLDEAVLELEWVLENSKDDGFLHLARIRLATVLLAQENFDHVLGLLNNVDKGDFAYRYDELIGDAYSLRGQDGDQAKAKTAYATSLENIPGESGYARIIQLKLDNVGES